jgi:AraC-like DNA-binding protein
MFWYALLSVRLGGMKRPEPDRTDSHAYLILPRTSLSSLLFAAIVRDTRGVQLTADEQFNFFPASPLCAVTWVREGSIHLVDAAGTIDLVPLPKIFATGPCSRPLVSWSASPVYAMSVGIYPDAWGVLTGVDATGLSDRSRRLDEVLAGDLLEIFNAIAETDDFRAGFDLIQARLEGLWWEVRPKHFAPWLRLENWTRALAARAVVSGTGHSARQIQRRIRSWTGHSLRELRLHARVEGLFARSRSAGQNVSLAEVAADAGYADQSHMGREVRRITGVSPARMKGLIRTDKRYWFYRLLGKRL